MKTASLWRTLSSGAVQCELCRHFCRLHAGEWGLCGVRGCTLSSDGQPQLITLVDEYVAALHIDPIEKKPLYHYLPGSKTLSLGTFGCNFDCAWCQNSTLSRPAFLFSQNGTHNLAQRLALCQQGYAVDAETIIHEARKHDCSSIAFTYNEPTVFFEMMRNCAGQAKKEGLGSVLISNGYQSPACLKELETLIDAANIDMKSFSDNTYRRYCGARLQGVLDNLIQMRRMGWWLEITTLIIPGLNDNIEEYEGIARFIYDRLGAETPWHISAFFPCRHMRNTAVTPLTTLQEALDAGRKTGLHHVYIGNVAGQNENTICPRCHTEIVQRRGFTAICRLHGDQCPVCGCKPAGIWHLPDFLPVDGGKR